MEDTVKTEVISTAACPQCGVEIRIGSDYCFNCGNKLDAVKGNIDAVAVPDKPATVTENGFRSNGPGAIKRQRPSRTRPGVRRLRSRPNEPVQVVWQMVEESGVRFLLWSLCAGLFATILIFLAYYLK